MRIILDLYLINNYLKLDTTINKISISYINDDLYYDIKLEYFNEFLQIINDKQNIDEIEIIDAESLILNEIFKVIINCNHITSLILRDCKLKNIKEEYLVKIIDSSITKLRINVDSNNMNIIYNELKNNSSITELTLKHCDNTELNEINIADMIKYNSSITKLNLSKNDFENIDNICEGLKINSSITELNLDNNKIENLKSLNEVLKVNSILTSLSLSNNNIKDLNDFSNVLKTNSIISSINLSHNYINDYNFNIFSEVLKSNTSISSLDLSFNNITSYDNFFDILKTNSSLTELKILMIENSNNNLNLSEMIKSNSSLVKLDLLVKNNSLTSNIPYIICKALKVNNTLYSLSINILNIYSRYYSRYYCKKIYDYIFKEISPYNITLTELFINNLFY